MSVFTTAAFDVKCLNLLADQDAGSQTRGTLRKNAELYYITANSLGLRFGIGDITTYGGNAFKTGSCCGWVSFDYLGYTYNIGVDTFDEVKTGNDAFYRFNYRNLTFKSSSFVPDG